MPSDKTRKGCKHEPVPMRPFKYIPEFSSSQLAEKETHRTVINCDIMGLYVQSCVSRNRKYKRCVDVWCLHGKIWVAAGPQGWLL